MEQFSRTTAILGREGLDKLQKSSVAIFGLGGVGSYAVESLAKAHLFELVLDLVDNDIVDVTNVNRQIIALHSTLGQAKVDVAKARVLDINPKTNVVTHKVFYTKDSAADVIEGCDYVVDAIDTVSSKLALVQACKQKKIPIISCMGTGNKLEPTMFEVADIFCTSVCPLCRVMRHELRKIGIDSLKVVYSKEVPIRSDNGLRCCNSDSSVPGSVPFVPPVAGLIVASEVVKDIILARI